MPSRRDASRPLAVRLLAVRLKCSIVSDKKTSQVVKNGSSYSDAVTFMQISAVIPLMLNIHAKNQCERQKLCTRQLSKIVATASDALQAPGPVTWYVEDLAVR